MQVSSVSSSSAWYSSKSAKLTDEEKSALQEILSRYDAENLSEEDEKALMEELKDSGIKPTAEVKKLIADAGFELPESPAKPEGMGNPMEMLFAEDEETSSTSDLSSLLEQYKNGEISEEELRAQLSEITASVLYGFNSSVSGSLLNIEA